mgnify:FL=1
MKLKESALLENISRVLDANGFVLDKCFVGDVIESIVEASSDFLRMVKTKSKVALVHKDIKGNFIVAAVVDYNENPEDGQDNYNYYWTFYPEDIEDATIHDGGEAKVTSLISQRLQETHGLRPRTEHIVIMIEKVLLCLRDYLDQNAKEGEEFQLEDEGYFIATVGVENEKIVKSFLPAGPMKVLIKDDATVEA